MNHMIFSSRMDMNHMMICIYSLHNNKVTNWLPNTWAQRCNDFFLPNNKMMNVFYFFSSIHKSLGERETIPIPKSKTYSKYFVWIYKRIYKSPIKQEIVSRWDQTELGLNQYHVLTNQTKLVGKSFLNFIFFFFVLFYFS